LENVLLRWRRKDGNAVDQAGYDVSDLVQVNPGDDGSKKD
jgi:hypothetical protein